MEPDHPALRWAVTAAGARSLELVRPLAGSSTGALDVLRPGSGRWSGSELVLRRYTKPELVAKHPDLAAREAVVLARLEGSGLPVPRLVAVDPDGAVAGVPSILMTLVEGDPVLRPGPVVDRSAWVDGLVGALAAVHACSGDGFDPIEPWFRPDALAVPAWADDPGPWRAAFGELAAGVPVASARLVHRDLHPGNVLWARRRVTGIVDWVNAGSGSPAADLARCRANVAVLADVATAETVLNRYRHVTGRDLPDQRWWDLADLASIATQVVPGSSMLDAIVAGPAQLGIVLEPGAAGAALEELLRVVLVS